MLSKILEANSMAKATRNNKYVPTIKLTFRSMSFLRYFTII